jgi:hypothetical protein
LACCATGKKYIVRLIFHDILVVEACSVNNVDRIEEMVLESASCKLAKSIQGLKKG